MFFLQNLKISILQVKVSRVAKYVGVARCCAAGGVGQTLKSLHDKDDDDDDKDENNGVDNNNNDNDNEEDDIAVDVKEVMMMRYLPGWEFLAT